MEETNNRASCPAEPDVRSATIHIHPPLPYVETLFYWALWVSCLVSAVYSLIHETEDAKDELYSGDFAEGWKVIGRQKDISDFEWQFWLGLVRVLLPTLVLHMIIGNVVSRTFPKLKPYFCLMFTLVFMTGVAGFLPVLFMVSHCVITYLCAMTQSVVAVWISSLLLLVSLQQDETRVWQMEKLTDDHLTSDLILFISLMANLRCISFGLEYCWQHTDQTPENEKREKLGTSFLDFMVFNFYLPLLGNGPVITYSSFYGRFYSYTGQVSKEELWSTIRDSVKILLWFIVLEVSLHLVYSSAVSREPQVYMYMSSWSFCGLVYCTLIVFLTKYIVFYGSTAVLMRLDGLDPPKPPRCVSTFYLFTDMWRYFDRGLYEWMKRYIYFPLGGSRRGLARQMLASFCPFAYIWYWHGGNATVGWWMIINWLGITAEGLADKVLKVPTIQQLEGKLSPAMCRRVRALFGVLTVVPLILSNMVFLTGTPPVAFFLKKIFYYGFPVAPFLLYITMYCSVQTNMELNRYRNGQW